MKASIGGNGDFELTPAGNHIARIYSIVDIGMQETLYGEKRQIIISFELLNEKMEDGRPFVTSKWYTLSLNGKAGLCIDIESMYGKKMSDEAKQNFDFEKLLNAPTMLNVLHEVNQEGHTKAKARALSPLPKGTKAPALFNDTVFYDLDAADDAVFQALPEWISDRVNFETETEIPKVEESSEVPDFDDDIPF